MVGLDLAKELPGHRGTSGFDSCLLGGDPQGKPLALIGRLKQIGLTFRNLGQFAALGIRGQPLDQRLVFSAINRGKLIGCVHGASYARIIVYI